MIEQMKTNQANTVSKRLLTVSKRLVTINKRLVTVTVRLIYEYFVLCRAYYYSIGEPVNVIVNACMIMNALNTVPHFMCMYILLDICVNKKHIDQVID